MRSLGTSFGWLGGTARRWVALVSAAATVAGIVSFAITEHIGLAWLAIGGLLLLVVSLAWTAHDEHTKTLAINDPAGTFLTRAIEDGRAMLSVIDPSALMHHWQRWRDETYEGVREHFGLGDAMRFAESSQPIRRQDVRDWVRREIIFLEGLREQH